MTMDTKEELMAKSRYQMKSSSSNYTRSYDTQPTPRKRILGGLFQGFKNIFNM